MIVDAKRWRRLSPAEFDAYENDANRKVKRESLKLSMKVGLLVAVLLATILVVAGLAWCSCPQLDARFESLVKTTSRAIQLTGDGQSQLLMTIRPRKGPPRSRSGACGRVCRACQEILRGGEGDCRPTRHWWA